MNPTVTVTPKQLGDLLLNIAVVRPVFIWGQPGIGKSALVQGFAASIGLPCVSLLGSQLAPEDIIGVPQILEGTSRFCPPQMIARPDPYCLFLDELNLAPPAMQGMAQQLQLGPNPRTATMNSGHCGFLSMPERLLGALKQVTGGN